MINQFHEKNIILTIKKSLILISGPAPEPSQWLAVQNLAPIHPAVGRKTF